MEQRDGRRVPRMAPLGRGPCPHHLRREGGGVDGEAAARAWESMPAELLDVPWEAKRAPPLSGRRRPLPLLLSFLKSHSLLSPAFWPQSFAPSSFLSKLLAAAPGSQVLSSALDVANLALVPLARVPLPLMPRQSTAQLLLEFPTSEYAPVRTKGKREEAENRRIRDMIRRFEELE